MLSNRLFPACPRALLLASMLTLVAAVSPAQSLPAEVTAALAKARVPADALTVLVTDVDGRIPPRLAHRAGVAVNPASIMKLVTTYAAIEHLGVGWTWRTPVYLEGPIQGDVLQGNVYIRGQGDPKLVVERLWLLLRRLQGLGIRSIQGDIVLDHSAFEAVATDPAAFDGEPLRPYNAAPDALLLNYKSFALTLVPDARNGVAQVQLEPPLWGVRVPRSVPLAAAAECGDWRTALKADFSDPSQIRLGGVFAAGCGEKVWPVAYADPASFATRAVDGLWRQMGGQLTGRVRDGSVPAALVPAFELVSPALPEVIRDINKYSNNVMAQQLFLTLSLNARGSGTLAGSRELVRAWWKERFGDAETPVLDNGAGLSRTERISAQALGRLLQAAWASPQMPELVSSLPVTGVDGTLRRSKARAGGAAHLKTGSLRDVTGVAGYVHAASGRRYVLVAIVNHPGAAVARPAIEALIDWAQRD